MPDIRKFSENPAPPGKILDVGCGGKKSKGALGVDKLDLPGVDIVHNLEEFPYPFEDNEFSEVLCHHVLEHLSDQVGVMEELHRITSPDGWIRIEVPYFTSYDSYRDPTHVVHHTYYSFHYFVDGHELANCNYSDIRFRVGAHKLVFTREWGMGAILSKLSMRRYEKYYAYRHPARKLFIELQPVKNG